MKTDPDHGPMDNQEAVSNRRIDAIEAELFLERSLRVAAQEAIAPQAERIAELQRRLENEEIGGGERLHQERQKNAALEAKNAQLRELVKAKNEALEKITNIRWGADGDCGAGRIAEDALALTPDNFPTETKGGAA